MVERRRYSHNLPRLRMNREFTAHTAIRTDRFCARLLRLVPGPSGAHVVLGLEHQGARGTHADAIAAIDASGLRKRNIKLRGNMRGKTPPGDTNRKCILRIHTASFHALVAKNALRVVAHVEFVVDFRWLRHRLGPRAESLRPRTVAL